eukprot:854107-Amorphochlora_amoeboformis.AAC.1
MSANVNTCQQILTRAHGQNPMAATRSRHRLYALSPSLCASKVVPLRSIKEFGSERRAFCSRWGEGAGRRVTE